MKSLSPSNCLSASPLTQGLQKNFPRFEMPGLTLVLNSPGMNAGGKELQTLLGFSPTNNDPIQITRNIIMQTLYNGGKYEQRDFRSEVQWIWAGRCRSWAPQINPAIILILNARIIVLNANESTPCVSVSRLSLRSVTCTSDTWQVIPTTNE